MFRNLNIKTKVAIHFGMFVFLMIAIFGLFFNIFLDEGLKEGVKIEKIEEISELIAKYPRDFITDNNGKLNSTQIDELTEVFIRNASHVILYNPDGSYVESFGKYKSEQMQQILDLKSETIKMISASKEIQFEIGKMDDFENTMSVLYFPLIKDGKVIMVIQFTEEASTYDAFKSTNLLIFFFFLFIYTIIGGFISYYFSKWIFTPLRKMLRKMKLSNANNLQTKMYIKGLPDDEFDELAETYNDMLDRINEGVEKQKQFTANISHELRKPMVNVVSDLDMIEINIAEKEIKEAQKKISELKKYVIDLSFTLDGMLELAQMSSDPTKYEYINLKESVQEALNIVSDEINESNLKINIDIPSELKVGFSKQHLMILLNNIINNAVKYNKKDGLIEIKSMQIGNHVGISIKDTGIGIEPKVKEKIFTRFYRAKSVPASLIKGYGVGLDLVNTVCLMHKIKLNIESQLGKGTTVTLNGFHSV